MSVENTWYDLFSRGARDWLRHNVKLRDAVKAVIPDIIKSGEAISGGNQTVRVPYRMLEHYRLRLLDMNQTGVGQGPAKPGDVLGEPNNSQPSEKGQGGFGAGQILVEMKIDDIIDWLWDELKLPNLKPKELKDLEEKEWIREGLDKRGARSRLDKRQTIKNMLKRQAAANSIPTIINDDLRYRQLKLNKKPNTDAVVFFLLDVSGSMTQNDKRKAKSFFFWTIQGLRRQYKKVIPIFIAHATEAQEFFENEFFDVSGTGGTETSSGLKKVREIYDERFSLNHNCYLYYASDGDNAVDDHDITEKLLEGLLDIVNFAGYVEIASLSTTTELSSIWDILRGKGRNNLDKFLVNNDEAVIEAVRYFFTKQE